MKFCTSTIICSYQVKMFSKVTNTHLYINQNETKQKNIKIYTTHDSPYD